MTDRDPLPHELETLFAAERAPPVGDAETRAKVRSRLAAVVTLLPAKAAAATGTATLLGGTGKIITIFAISIGVGVTAVTVAKDSEPSSAASPTIQLVESEAIEASSIPQQVVQLDQGPVQSATPEMKPSPAENGEPTLSARASSEAKLLKRAWSALSSGDAQQTLDLTREAERLHPGGVLVEEREALRVQALAKLGLLGDARAAAEQFIVQFPRSVHRTRVERAVTAEASP